MFIYKKYQLCEVPGEYWDFVQQYGTIYQTRAYLQCLLQTTLIIVIYDGEKIVGGSAVVLGHKFGNRWFSGGIYFGPVTSDVALLPELIDGIKKFIDKTCISYSITFWPAHYAYLASKSVLKGFHTEEIEFLHWDITGPLADFWSVLPKSKRRCIERAQRQGVIIKEITTVAEIKQFYQLHLMSMNRGEKVVPMPLAYYEKLLTVLRPQNYFLGFMAFHPQTNIPLAGMVILLGLRGWATHLAVGHNYEYRKLGAADDLEWHTLQHLKSLDFTTCDLVGLPKGDSPRSQGIRSSKLAWTGEKGFLCPSCIAGRALWGLNQKYFKKTADIMNKFIR